LQSRPRTNAILHAAEHSAVFTHWNYIFCTSFAHLLYIFCTSFVQEMHH
jgi:hypothetical protein